MELFQFRNPTLHRLLLTLQGKRNIIGYGPSLMSFRNSSSAMDCAGRMRKAVDTAFGASGAVPHRPEGRC